MRRGGATDGAFEVLLLVFIVEGKVVVAVVLIVLGPIHLVVSVLGRAHRGGGEDEENEMSESPTRVKTGIHRRCKQPRRAQKQCDMI